VEVKVRLVTQVEVRAIASTASDVDETVNGEQLVDELRVCHPIAVLNAHVSRERWTGSRATVSVVLVGSTRHPSSVDGTIVPRHRDSDGRGSQIECAVLVDSPRVDLPPIA
jgi:hypothetical protein